MAKITGLSNKHVDHLIAKLDAVMAKAAMQTFAMAAHNIVFASSPSVVAAVSNSGETEFHDEPMQYASDTALSVIQLEWLSHVTNEILPFLGKVYMQSAASVTVNVKENVPTAANVALSEVGAEAAEQFLIAASNRVKSFSSRMWEVAKQELADGVSKGQSIEKIAQRVASATAITQKKASVISQTEVISAVNAGEFAQMRTLASTFDFVTTKEWVATHDTHTRPSHLAANGQKVALNEKFDVGESFLDFPGDPTGSPAEIISCRCTTVYEIADSDEISQPQTSPGALSAAGLLDTTEQFSALSYDEMLDTLCAIVASNWNPSEHPRGNDGKFIKKGFLPDAVLDILKGGSPAHLNANQQHKIAQGLNVLGPSQWAKLTPAQKSHLQDVSEQLIDANVPDAYLAAQTLEELVGDEDDFANINVFDPDNELPDTPTPEPSKIPNADHVNDPSFTKEYWDSLNPKAQQLFKKKIGDEAEETEDPDTFKAFKKLQGFEKQDLDAKNAELNDEIAAELNQLGMPSTSAAPQKATPIKITHALIHAKHGVGEVVAQTQNGMVRVKWNGKAYDVEVKTSTSWMVAENNIKKSGTYAFLAKQYPNAQWVKPGKQDNENSAPNLAATKPAPNVIPTPVADASTKITKQNLADLTAPAPGYVGPSEMEKKVNGQYMKGLLTTQEWQDAIAEIKAEEAQEKDPLTSDPYSVVELDTMYFNGSITDAEYKELMKAHQIPADSVDQSKIGLNLKTDPELVFLDYTLTYQQEKGAVAYVLNADKAKWNKLSPGDQAAITHLIDDALDSDISGAEDAQYELFAFAGVDPADAGTLSTPTSSMTDASKEIVADKLIYDVWIGQPVAYGKNKQGKNIVVEKSNTNELAVYLTEADGKTKKGPAAFLTQEMFKNATWGGDFTPAPIFTPATPSPTATTTNPVDKKTLTVDDVSMYTKTIFYNTFKAEKVSPAWSGAKIFASIQTAKAKHASDPLISQLSDGQLLLLVDKHLNDLGKNKSTSKTPYSDKVTDWLKTPAGNKAVLKAKFAAKSGTSTTGVKTSATPVTPTSWYTPATSAPTMPSVVAPISAGPVLEKVSSAKLGEAVAKLPSTNGAVVATIQHDGAVYTVESSGVLFFIKKNGTSIDAGYVASELSKGASFWVPNATWDIIDPSVPSIPTGTPIPIPGLPEAAQTILSGDADISSLPPKGLEEIYTIFKSQGAAAYLDTDAETLFKTAQKIAESNNNLTAGQVLKIVDAHGAKKFGVENKFMFETKVKTHLQDPLKLLDATHVVPISEAKFLHNAPSVSTVVNLGPQPSGTKAEILAKSSSDFKVKSTKWAITTFNDIVAKTPFKTGQKEALKEYTGSNYHQMNGALRMKTGVDPYMLKKLNNAQSGMRPIPEDVLVHRGTGWSQFGAIKNAAEAKQLVGKTLQDKAFISASVGGTAAFGGAVSMEIEIPKGTGVMYVDTFSKNKGENELLLAAGLRYRVLSVTDKGGYGGGVTVRVRIIPPPDGSV